MTPEARVGADSEAEMMIAEPDVTLTDYGVAIECSVFAFLLLEYAGPQDALRSLFTVFFGSVGLAALAGGTVHGFFLDEESVGHAILWPTTFIAIGLSALAGWAIGAKLLFAPGVARAICILAAVQFVGYCIAVMFINRTFALAVINYLPATLFLAFAFGATYIRTGGRELLVGLAGLVLTLVAALLQHAKIALPPRYFTHNAFYHLIQALALLLIFKAARWLVGAVELTK